MMEKIPVPFAVSGITRPEKIRTLIYANNQIAHVPLSEMLKAAVQYRKTDAGHYICFSDGIIVQFGYTDQFDANGYTTVTVPVAFQEALFCPLAVACGDGNRDISLGVELDRHQITRTGFGIRMVCLNPDKRLPVGGGAYWLAIGR